MSSYSYQSGLSRIKFRSGKPSSAISYQSGQSSAELIPQTDQGATFADGSNGTESQVDQPGRIPD